MSREIMPGVTMELLALGETTMTVKVVIKKGAEVPRHHHKHEQTSFVHHGCLVYILGGLNYTLNKGDGLVIKPNVPHSCIALADTVDINTFCPPREDYLHLLREEKK